MANPNQQYPHPGPSFYHTPPPHPQYPYGPGAVSYYPYPMNTMNGHSPPHQPASPRMNGGGRGGYHPHRAGGPNYQHFPHVPHQHYLPHQPMSPAPVPPVSPYAHSQKYPTHPQQMPYSSPYAPPPNGPYTPAWSTQTLSPLPKQLSMPVQLPPPPPAAESPISLAGPEAGQGIIPSIPPPEPSEPPPSFPPPPMDEVQADQFSEPSHTPIDRAPTPDSPASTSSRISQGSAIGSTFVIWSRKPRDPSRAAGVIISSRAHPPDEIIQMAQDLATPPASPRVRSIKLAAPVPIVTIIEAVETASEPAPVPSSSATETTSPSSEAPDTPVPGSPLSTNTSVSAAVASPASKVEPLSSTVTLIVACGAEATAGTAIDTVPVIVETAEQPSVSEKIQSVEASTEPTSVPIKLAPPVAKKSWASLLQTSDAAASSSKSGLPRASVVGFSIPAGLSGSAGSPSSPSSGVPVRPELLNLLNDGPTGPAPPPKIRPRGLVNTGNMCFANAVLQVLVYCPPFYRLFTELGKYVSGPVVGSQKEGTNATPLIDATIQFLKEFGRKGSEVDPRAKGKEREDDFDELDSFIPTYVYDVMKEKKRFASMVGGHQEDAEEFLGFFLDTLEEELLSISSTFLKQASTPPVEKNMEGAPKQDEGWFEVGKKNRTSTTRTVKTADSPITRIFGGKFRSTLRAPHQRDSITVEDWRSLRLDIQREQVHTIKDALQYISNPHAVEISSPTRPGVIEASRQELIESLPPVLILHLKRFEYDTKVGDVVKIGKQVTFGPEMEIGSDLLSPARKTSHPVKYQLFGALYHHGLSASGGHYTLDVLHPNREMNDRPRQAWIRIDDELVSDIRPEDVFGGQDRDDRCAYLLFYRRIGGSTPAKAWSHPAS